MLEEFEQRLCFFFHHADGKKQCSASLNCICRRLFSHKNVCSLMVNLNMFLWVEEGYLCIIVVTFEINLPKT